jgi:hypothetical protein
MNRALTPTRMELEILAVEAPAVAGWLVELPGAPDSEPDGDSLPPVGVLPVSPFPPAFPLLPPVSPPGVDSPGEEFPGAEPAARLL